MNINDVKQIKIADYLQSLGYEPVKQQGRSLWYKSPLRDEKEPSFKVNTELNKWYDFGIGKGGNIIALAEELYNSNNVSYLLDCISKQMPPSDLYLSLLAGNLLICLCSKAYKLERCSLHLCYPICRNEE